MPHLRFAPIPFVFMVRCQAGYVAPQTCQLPIQALHLRFGGSERFMLALGRPEPARFYLLFHGHQNLLARKAKPRHSAGLQTDAHQGVSGLGTVSACPTN